MDLTKLTFATQIIYTDTGLTLNRMVPDDPATNSKIAPKLNCEELNDWLEENKGRIALGAEYIVEYVCGCCGEANTKGFPTIDDIQESNLLQQGLCIRCFLEKK